MTEPVKRFWMIPTAALVALLAALSITGPTGEGYRHIPYYDSVKVLTVCHGITGAGVVKGKYYSDDACRDLEAKFLVRMVQGMGSCLTKPLSFKEWVAWGHFSYNVGTPTFCQSTAAKLINQQKYREACDQMLRFKYAGGKDCTIKANNCRGVITRRKWEWEQCVIGANGQ